MATHWPAHYGSDAEGLICAYGFERDTPPRAIGLAEALQWLADPAPAAASRFVWLHFNLNDASVRHTLEHRLPIVPEFFEALHQGSRSTRIEHAPPALIAVVNDVAYEFSFDPSELASVWVQASQRLLISCRQHPLRSIDRLRTAVRQGQRFESPLGLLAELFQDQGHVLEQIVRQATQQVDGIEDGLLSGRLAHRRRDLSALRRVLVRLERLLAPEPGAMSRLMRNPPEWAAPSDLEALRQASEEVLLVLSDLAGLKERIKLLQEEIAAQAAEQSNRSLFALTAFTVLALPINLVAGLMGMNVGGIPLAEHPHGFVWIAGAAVSVTALAGTVLLWRRRSAEGKV